MFLVQRATTPEQQHNCSRSISNMLSTRGECVQVIDHFVLLDLQMNSGIKVGVDVDVENDDLETHSSGITVEAITRMATSCLIGR